MRVRPLLVATTLIAGRFAAALLLGPILRALPARARARPRPTPLLGSRPGPRSAAAPLARSGTVLAAGFPAAGGAAAATVAAAAASAAADTAAALLAVAAAASAPAAAAAASPPATAAAVAASLAAAPATRLARQRADERRLRRKLAALLSRHLFLVRRPGGTRLQLQPSVQRCAQLAVRAALVPVSLHIALHEREPN